MDWTEFGPAVCTAILFAAILFLPKRISFRNRAIAGAVLFPLGWAGIFGGLALGDKPFMQSETVVWLWIGSSAMAMVFGIVFLVPVGFEWLGKRLRRKGRVGKWHAGHWKP